MFQESLFLGDEIRRLVTETIIPFITEHVSQWRIKRQFCKIHKLTKVQEQVSNVTRLNASKKFRNLMTVCASHVVVSLISLMMCI